MRVCLIHPKMYVKAYDFFPLGLGSIAAALEKEGVEYLFYDLHRNWLKTSTFLKEIKDEKIDLFGITGLLTSYNDVERLCSALRKNFPEAKIVLGGRLTSARPDLLFKNLDLDYIIKGEGEVALLELLEMLEGKRKKTEVQGLINRKGM